ncbi:MAG TPA: carboxypeptidase-like regulatory domain-containing protein, partial [Pyrinomonadaceae bacterium]|nr:carboxypeptidase-like regulatory domain-containing protein [Pyrinomonadaceae bacterium]
MTNRSLGRFVLLTISFLLVLLGCVSAFGQSTSHINGTVTDPQGNVVPGATVTLKDATKNFSRSQTTSDSGHFSLTLIPPGTYQLTVEAKGFKKALLT